MGQEPVRKTPRLLARGMPGIGVQSKWQSSHATGNRASISLKGNRQKWQRFGGDRGKPTRPKLQYLLGVLPTSAGWSIFSVRPFHLVRFLILATTMS